MIKLTNLLFAITLLIVILYQAAFGASYSTASTVVYSTPAVTSIIVVPLVSDMLDSSDKLRNCLENKGGNACYQRYDTCVKYGGGNACKKKRKK